MLKLDNKQITKYTNQLQNPKKHILDFLHNDNINNFRLLTATGIQKIFSEENIKEFLNNYFSNNIKDYDNPITAVMIYILVHGDKVDNKECQSFISKYPINMQSTFELSEYFRDIIVSQIKIAVTNIDLNPYITPLNIQNRSSINNINNISGSSSSNNINVAKKIPRHPDDKLPLLKYCISLGKYEVITHHEWELPIKNDTKLDGDNFKVIRAYQSDMELSSFIPAYLGYAKFTNEVASFFDIKDKKHKEECIQAFIDHIVDNKDIKDYELRKQCQFITPFVTLPSDIKKYHKYPQSLKKELVELIKMSTLRKPTSLIEENLTFTKIKEFNKSDQDDKNEIIQNTLDKINNTITDLTDDKKSLLLLKLYNIDNKDFSKQKFIEWFMLYVYDLTKLPSAQQQKICDWLNTLRILIKKAPNDNYKLNKYINLNYKDQKYQNQAKIDLNNPHQFCIIDENNNSKDYEFKIENDPFCKHKHTITITAKHDKLLNDFSKINEFISKFLAAYLTGTPENTEVTSVGNLLKTHKDALTNNYEISEDDKSLSFYIIANLGK